MCKSTNAPQPHGIQDPQALFRACGRALQEEMVDRQQQQPTQQPVVFYPANNPPPGSSSLATSNGWDAARPLMVNGWNDAKNKGKDIFQRLNAGSGSNSIAMHWFYFVIKVLTSITTLFGFVVGLVIIGSVLFYDSPELSVFVANTFYTSNDNEQNVSWQMITSPSWNSDPRYPLTSYNTIAFEHYYECLWVSQLGWPLCNGSSATVATYQSCLQASYAPQLAICSTTTNGTSYIWPTANQYSNCVTNQLGGSRWNLNAFKTCIRTDLWPLFEIPQDVDTAMFLGAFSWPLFMLTAFFLILAFAFYTIWPIDWEDSTIIEYGKPRGVFHRLGMCWTLFPIVIIICWTSLMLAVSFRSGGSWPNNNVNLYPSTQQTNVIVVTASFAVLFYFFVELSEFRDTRALMEKAMKSPFIAPLIPLPLQMNTMSKGQYSAVMTGDTFPAGDMNKQIISSIVDAGMAYTPVLLNTWSDAYLLDPLFIIGAMGATLQMTTIDVFNVFVALMVHRILHIGVARMIYQAYVIHYYDVKSFYAKDDSGRARKGKKGDDFVEGEEITVTSKDAHVNFSFKVIALAFHFAAVCAVVVLITILFDSTRIFYEFSIFSSLIVTAIIIPEALKLLGHLFLAVVSFEPGSGHKGVLILVFAHFIWFWDLLIRVIFMWIYFWGDPGNRGTKPFLLNRFFNLTYTLGYTMF